MVAFPDRRAGTGLYAFVEAEPPLTEAAARDYIAEALGRTKPPEHLQVTEELPRRPSGEIRSEILQLVAMNQVDLIDNLIASDRERALIQRILADQTGIGEIEFQPSRPLEELGIDSLAVTEAMFRLEDEFGIQMPSTQFPIRTTQDIADLVDRLKREQAAIVSEPRPH